LCWRVQNIGFTIKYVGTSTRTLGLTQMPYVFYTLLGTLLISKC
jgi:hypothetical protein